MKKISIRIILCVILFLVGVSVYAQNHSSQRAFSEKMAMKERTLPSGVMRADTVRYMPYSEGTLEKAADSRRVLFFFANWCSTTCIPADRNFQKNTAKIPVDVRVIRVNYNDSDTNSEERALAIKYGVVYQHTFVQIDSKGNVVTKWNGGDIDELLSHII